MKAGQLSQEIDTCRLLACKCKTCKQKPEMYYTPGCTKLYCPCIKVVLPDWQPRAALRIWNQLFLQNEWSQIRADQLIQEQMKKELYPSRDKG